MDCSYHPGGWIRGIRRFRHDKNCGARVGAQQCAVKGALRCRDDIIFIWYTFEQGQRWW